MNSNLSRENLLKRLPPRLAQQWRVVPQQPTSPEEILIACDRMPNLETIENLQTLFGSALRVEIIDGKEFSALFECSYGIAAAALDDEGGASLIRFVDLLIEEAHRRRATDIHLEPFEDELQIRFRIDGLMTSVVVPSSLYMWRQELASRIKLMAGMNIAEKRLPQDGRMHLNVDDEELDIRLSTVPTVHGETIDLRILPRTRLLLGVSDLGMPSDCRTRLERIIQKPSGIFLVTGPTGHGKTTTLYACLNQLNTVSRKIITIEDPVEIRLRGVNQMQAHSKIGLTFAQGLRSILRQDPDVIMVGEIRDLETAEIAMRASLTGHQVFSTMHTNDSASAITRLLDIGVEPYLVASSLNGVLAQRLVRKICAACHRENPRCEKCRGTGFYGRTGIFELLELDDPLKQLIADELDANEIRRAAILSGMQTLFSDGIKKVSADVTVLSEVQRVCEEYV